MDSTQTQVKKYPRPRQAKGAVALPPPPLNLDFLGWGVECFFTFFTWKREYLKMGKEFFAKGLLPETTAMRFDLTVASDSVAFARSWRWHRRRCNWRYLSSWSRDHLRCSVTQRWLAQELFFDSIDSWMETRAVWRNEIKREWLSRPVSFLVKEVFCCLMIPGPSAKTRVPKTQSSKKLYGSAETRVPKYLHNIR